MACICLGSLEILAASVYGVCAILCGVTCRFICRKPQKPCGCSSHPQKSSEEIIPKSDTP